eukprot:gene19816-23700_t
MTFTLDSLPESPLSQPSAAVSDFMHSKGFAGYVTSAITRLPAEASHESDACPEGQLFVRGIVEFPEASSPVAWALRDAEGILSPILTKPPKVGISAHDTFCLDVTVEGVYRVVILDSKGSTGKVEIVNAGGCKLGAVSFNSSS